jgi:carbamoyl-phosphate synthase large subunit
MSAIKITVTGAGSLFGQGILKSLRDERSRLEMCIQGIDYFPDAFGFRYCDAVDTLPDLLSHDIDEDDWYEILVQKVSQFGSALLFVGVDFELLPLSKRQNEFFERTGCKIIISSQNVIEICKDKLRTIKFLQNHGVDVPKSCDGSLDFESTVETLGLPFILKPRFGSRSRGVSLIRSQQDLAFNLPLCKEPMLQEYLPDKGMEYSCGVLSIRNRVPIVSPLRRELRDGNTWSAVSSHEDTPINRSIIAYCKRISEVLKSDGPINIQCRIKDNTPYVFEINPRFSGTTYFRTLLGINEPLRIVQAYLGLPIQTGDFLKPGRVRRFFDECLEA